MTVDVSSKGKRALSRVQGLVLHTPTNNSGSVSVMAKFMPVKRCGVSHEAFFFPVKG